MDQNLTDLIQKKQKPSADGGGTIDWDARRDAYLAAVADLYLQVEQILAEPIRQKAVTPQRRSKQLTESYIGAYSVDDFILRIGNEQVRFSPQGRNVAGATGRVDVVGDRGEETLILLPGSRWGFVQSRQPTLRIVPFNEAVLADVLGLVMRD